MRRTKKKCQDTQRSLEGNATQVIVEYRNLMLQLKNVLFATDASNAELDIFSCLLNVAERKAGCKTLRKFSQYNSTGRPTDSNICYDMRPFQNAADEQLKWIEYEMAEADCVPSCTRHSYTLLDGIYSKIPNAGYVSLLPKPRKLVISL